MEKNIMLKNVNEPTFLLSASKPAEIPPLLSPREVAFLGGSNVGKSSLLSAIANKKNLARSSKTPGKTRLVNFFCLPPKIIVADIPGFGFANISRTITNTWQELVDAYFASRGPALMAYILIDCRRGVRTLDLDVMEMLGGHGVQYRIVFTKIDKLNKSETAALQQKIKDEIETPQNKVFITSAKDNIGVAELRRDMAWAAKEA
jgi:GTP-binding protein